MTGAVCLCVLDAAPLLGQPLGGVDPVASAPGVNPRAFTNTSTQDV